MRLKGNSFWVLYQKHTDPVFLEDAGDGQSAQRDKALSYVKSWRNCLDIGSNIGQWTRPLSHKFERVICFEPNKYFINCFNRNISEDNVDIYNVGLSDKEHQASQDKTSTVIIDKPGNVKCKTLDSYGFEDIDFIKIDVDGFEFNCVKGAIDTLVRNNAVLNIEMKRNKRPSICAEVEKILHKIGYKLVDSVKSDEVWLKT